MNDKRVIISLKRMKHVINNTGSDRNKKMFVVYTNKRIVFVNMVCLVFVYLLVGIFIPALVSKKKIKLYDEFSSSLRFNIVET